MHKKKHRIYSIEKTKQNKTASIQNQTWLFPNTNLPPDCWEDAAVNKGFDSKEVISEVSQPEPIIYKQNK